MFLTHLKCLKKKKIWFFQVLKQLQLTKDYLVDQHVLSHSEYGSTPRCEMKCCWLDGYEKSEYAIFYGLFFSPPNHAIDTSTVLLKVKTGSLQGRRRHFK